METTADTKVFRQEEVNFTDSRYMNICVVNVPLSVVVNSTEIFVVFFVVTVGSEWCVVIVGSV